MKKKFQICYECDPNMKGGYNHVKCRNGKKNRMGKIQVCNCPVCQVPGVKYKRIRLR